MRVELSGLDSSLVGAKVTLPSLGARSLTN